MIDPIEQLIVRRNLPRPTPNLDRRIIKLMTDPSTARTVSQKQWAGVLSLVGGALAVCTIGLVSSPSEDEEYFFPQANRSPEPPMVHSVEVDIPSLNSSDTTLDREWLFSPRTIVVTTRISEGEEK